MNYTNHVAPGGWVAALPVLRKELISLAAVLTGTALMLLGAVFVRVAFYSMHMTL